MLQPVTEHVYVLPAPFFGIDLFLYVICRSAEAVLIDSGINTTPQEYVIPAFQQAGFEPSLLVCTHGHVDHFGGNAVLREHYPNLKIALHTTDVSWAEDHERHLHEMYLCMPQTWQFADGGKSHLELCGANAAIDIHLRHGQQIQLSGLSWQVIHTPGHAPGEVVLYDRETGVVICGDVALGKGVVTPAGQRVPPYYADPTLYMAGIETAVALNGTMYCTGHNGALTCDQMLDLAAGSKEMVEWLDTYSLQALTPDKPLSLRDVVAHVSDKLPDYEVGFHLNASVQSHLLRHCAEGRARSVIVNDLKH